MQRTHLEVFLQDNFDIWIKTLQPMIMFPCFFFSEACNKSLKTIKLGEILEEKHLIVLLRQISFVK